MGTTIFKEHLQWLLLTIDLNKRTVCEFLSIEIKKVKDSALYHPKLF